MNIKKTLQDHQTVLLLMESIDYNDNVVAVVKQLSSKNVCYVTLNKTRDALLETFKKRGINVDNIVFIDAISGTMKQVNQQGKNCYFIRSPNALTDISIVVDKFLKHGFDYLVFDSLTNLLIYSKKAPVAAFVSRLVNKIKESKTRAVFYALSVREQEELIHESSIFVDKVVAFGAKR